jgi:hypothetical protein
MLFLYASTMFQCHHFQNFHLIQQVSGFTGGVEYPSLVESAEPVIDRTSKPYFVRQGSLLADNASSMRVAALDSVTESHQRVISSSTDRMNSSVRPGVNRGTKAAAVQTYEERSREATKLLLARDLENKPKEPEDSNKVQTQKDQEILRISKEKEADEERVRLLQDREEELVLNLTKMEEMHQIEVNNSSFLSYNRRNIGSSLCCVQGGLCYSNGIDCAVKLAHI